MKQPICLGYQVATPEVSPTPALTCLWGELGANLSLLAQTGYDAVEFMTLDPDKLDWAEIRRLLGEYGLRAVMVCTGELFGTLGLSFLSPKPATRARAVERMKRLIDFAAALDANVNVGRLRGDLMPPERENREAVLETLRELCEYAQPQGVDILLEPIERAEVNWLHTVAEGVELCRQANVPGLKVMMDCCAMAFEESDWRQPALAYGGDWVGHVHLTEKDRQYPGHSGAEPFEALARHLKAAGYTGPFVAEVLSLPTPRAAVEGAYQTMAPILGRVFGWGSEK